MKKSVKSKNNKKKSSQKPVKKGFSDVLRAFMLVGAIVAFSALVSCGVIMFHSARENSPQTAINNDREEVQELLPTAEPVSETKADPVIESQQNEGDTSTAAPPARTTSTTTPGTTSTTAPVLTSTNPGRFVQNAGTLVFVIDDAGNNIRELEPFLRIPGPLTIAVLPGLPHSAEAARRIRAAGKEVILHQPMEAIGGQYPGPGAIYSGMNAEEIKEILTRNISEVGPVAGINNHQGSKITIDKQAMETILSFCRDHGIYFLDSRTTAESVVPAVARQTGMRIVERNIFIDNEQNKNSMTRYIEDGLARAQRNGSAVMIGHTWSPELAPLLTEMFPVFTEQGYAIKTAGDTIKFSGN